MRQRSKSIHNGDVMAVVVVVLVVALLAALGFIAWQNFVVKPKEATKDTTTVSQSTQELNSSNSVTQSPAEAAPVLSLNEWGVEIPLKADSTKYTLKYRTFDGGDIYDVTTASCSGMEASHGGIVRKSTGNEWSTQLGEYYYSLMSPQATCSDDPAVIDKVTNEMNELKELIKGIREA